MKGLRITERFTSRESGSFKRYLNEISGIEMFTPAEEVECSIRIQNGDKNAVDEMVRRNLRFVVSVAKQYETATINLEDLVNEGNLGLILAAQQYKPSTGFKFITYAVFWIRKMILEYMAKNGRIVRIPSNKVNGISKLNQYISKLEQKHGRTVDISEVIDEYGASFTTEEISDLQNISMFNFESLDNGITDDNGSSLYDVISDSSEKATDHLVAETDMKKQISSILSTLKPRDKKIMISLYGLDGSSPMSLKEVGEQVGLTREMIRQIKEKSLSKLRATCVM